MRAVAPELIFEYAGERFLVRREIRGMAVHLLREHEGAPRTDVVVGIFRNKAVAYEDEVLDMIRTWMAGRVMLS